MQSKFAKIIFLYLLAMGELHAEPFEPLKALVNLCKTAAGKMKKQVGTKITEFRLDLRDKPNRRKEITDYVASLPWKKQIGRWVKVTYISDGMGEEVVEQAVHNSESISKIYSMVPTLTRRLIEESKSLEQRPEVGVYVVLLNDQILYTSELFTSGDHSSISNDVNEKEWEKMLKATRGSFRWPLDGIPEILFIHTHPTAYSPLSPPDVAHAERVGNFFRDRLDIPTKVTVIASPVPNDGDLLFAASVRR